MLKVVRMLLAVGETADINFGTNFARFNTPLSRCEMMLTFLSFKICEDHAIQKVSASAEKSMIRNSDLAESSVSLIMMVGNFS